MAALALASMPQQRPSLTAVLKEESSIEMVGNGLSKYDELLPVIGEDHQVVLSVLSKVTSETYRVRTNVAQVVLDKVFLKGVAVLRMLDRDMLDLASKLGNFEGNVLYTSLVRLRKAIMLTINGYTRMRGC